MRRDALSLRTNQIAPQHSSYAEMTQRVSKSTSFATLNLFCAGRGFACHDEFLAARHGHFSDSPADGRAAAVHRHQSNAGCPRTPGRFPPGLVARHVPCLCESWLKMLNPTTVVQQTSPSRGAAYGVKANHRMENGSFKDIEEILSIPELNDEKETYLKIRPYLGLD